MIDLGQEIDFSSDIKQLLQEKIIKFDSLSANEQKRLEKEFDQYIQTAAMEISNELDQNDLEKIQKPILDIKFSNFLIMSNLPKIPVSKQELLKNVLKKIMTQKGIINSLVNIHMGFEGELSNGFAFMEFKNEENIRKAIQELNNLELDKQHTLKTYSIQEYEQILLTKEELFQPEILKQSELQNWCLESAINEQILLRLQGDRIQMGWVDHLQDKINPLSWDKDDDNGDGTHLKTIQDIGIDKVQFSPQGTYLVVYIPTGFSLYGGDKMVLLNTFQHSGVKNVIFSNNEHFIISYNGTVLNTSSQENYVVWNTVTGKKLRSFKADSSENYIPNKRELIIFSPDSEFLIKRGPQENYLSFFSMEKECKLLKILENIPNIQSMQFWCPNNPLIKNKQQILMVMSYGNEQSAKIYTIDMETLQESSQFKWKTINQSVSNVTYVLDPVLRSTSNNAALFLQQDSKKNKKNNIQVQVGLFNKKKMEIEDKDFSNKYKYFNYKNNKICMIFEEHNSLSGHTRWDFDFFILNNQN